MIFKKKIFSTGKKLFFFFYSMTWIFWKIIFKDLFKIILMSVDFSWKWIKIKQLFGFKKCKDVVFKKTFLRDVDILKKIFSMKKKNLSRGFTSKIFHNIFLKTWI